MSLHHRTTVHLLVCLHFEICNILLTAKVAQGQMMNLKGYGKSERDFF